MSLDQLITALGIPFLTLLVELIKRVMKLAGVPADIVLPLLTIVLGIAYALIAKLPVAEAGWLVTGATTVFKLVNASRKAGSSALAAPVEGGR